ncbi:MAG: hypothetical protein ACLPKI_05515 [Streptosporangiaceae bacterium]
MKSWVKVARYHLVRPVLFVTLPLAILAFVFAVDVARGGDTFRDGLGGIFLMFFITGVQRIGGWLPFGLALGATSAPSMLVPRCSGCRCPSYTAWS